MKRVRAAGTLAAIVIGLHGPQFTSSSADDNRGVIQGTVSYEDGQPVGNATVYTQLLDRPVMGIVPHATTDERGHFVVSHLWLGKDAVGGEKLDEGYADMTRQFYSNGKFKTVVLSSGSPAANVRIQLGPKAGTLVGTVVDSVTKVALNPCVEFRRAKNPSNFLSGTGLVNAKYRVLVPSNTDVFMSVWYGAHKTWYYPGTTQKGESRPLNLKPGEALTVDIHLEPDPDAQLSGCGMPMGTVVNP